MCVPNGESVRNKLIALASRLIKRAISLMAAPPWVRQSRALIQNSIVIRRPTQQPPDYVDSLTVAVLPTVAEAFIRYSRGPENQLTFINVPS